MKTNKTAFLGRQMGLNPVASAFQRAGWTVTRGTIKQALPDHYDACVFWAASWSQYQPFLDRLRTSGSKVIYAELAWLPQSKYIYLDLDGTGAKSVSLSSIDISEPLTAEQSTWLDSQLQIYRQNIKPGALIFPAKPPYVLVPLQTDRDINIREWSPISNMNQFIKFLSQIKGIPVYAKPHPRRFSKYQAAILETEMKDQDGVHILPDQCDLKTLIHYASAVLTINSCVGIEAMVWGKPIITLGKSFFSRSDIAHPYDVDTKMVRKMMDSKMTYPVAVRKMMTRKGTTEIKYEEPKEKTELRGQFTSEIQQVIADGVSKEMQENRRRWLFHLCERQLPIEAFQENDIIERILSGDFKQRWHGNTKSSCGTKNIEIPDRQPASSAQVQA